MSAKSADGVNIVFAYERFEIGVHTEWYWKLILLLCVAQDIVGALAVGNGFS